MIGEVFCNDNEEKFKQQRKKVALARERLNQFPKLKSVFNDFEDYEDRIKKSKDIPNNVVFNLLSSRYYDNTYTQNNLIESAGTINSIKKLEDALNQFFVTNRREYQKFCNRLSDYDNFTSLQAYNEIIVALEIGKKIGFNNVDLHYKSVNGKEPDLRISLNGKHIFLELTALETRVPEKKIPEIASTIANHILKKCSYGEYLISVLFDTLIFNQFKDSLGHIVVKDAVDYLKHLIDELYLEDLVGLKVSLDFHGRRIQIEGEDKLFFPTTLAIIHISPEYEEGKSLLEASNLEIIDLTSNIQNSEQYKQIKSWSEKISLNDFLDCPFDKIGFSLGGNKGCVYINSLDFDSTDPNLQDSYLVSTSQIVKSSFIDHIKRRIDDKIERAQYENDSPFVIAIQASQWQFEYEYDYDDFVPIRNNIQEYLKKYTQVSGVVLFTTDIYHGKFISNPKAIQKINDALEGADLLYRYSEPRYTHDMKVELTGMSYVKKAQRITEMFEDKKFQTIKDTDLTGYVRQDLEEFLSSIKVILEDENVEHKMLLLIEPIVIKYSQFTERDEDSESRNDLITEEKLFYLSNIPIRAYSASCLIRLYWHLRKEEYVTLINSLADDSNSYVREAVCADLPYLFDINSKNSLLIAEKYCCDDKYVRWNLRNFLDYLLQKDREKALEIFSIIINKYGKSDLADAGERILLRFAVNRVTQLSLMFQLPHYTTLLDKLITNGEYTLSLKKDIIATLRAEQVLKDSTLVDRSMQYYLKLLKQNSLEVKEAVEFYLLFELIQRNVSLLPKIKLLLNEISLIKHPVPSENSEQATKFTILDYIDNFFECFPKEATQYFLKVLELNDFLTDSLKIYTIISILGKIFDSNLDVVLKKQAKKVLNSIDTTKHWQARNLSDKVVDL